MIEALHEKVHLVDSAEPERVLTLDTPAPPEFKVKLAVTSRQEVTGEWLVDQLPAVAIAGHGPTFSHTPVVWKPGRHVVRFLVSDVTPFDGGTVRPLIRSFPHEVRWTVHVRTPAPVPLEPVGERFTAGP